MHKYITKRRIYYVLLWAFVWAMGCASKPTLVKQKTNHEDKSGKKNVNKIK